MALFNKKNPTSTAEQSTTETATKDLYGAEVKTKGQTAKKTNQYYWNLANRVLVKPLVTEKTTNLVADGQYVFAVAIDANKIDVAKAIEGLYGVKPIKVNMARLEGKAKRVGGHRGRRRDWKKAIVNLPAGKTIDVYEGV